MEQHRSSPGYYKHICTTIHHTPILLSIPYYVVALILKNRSVLFSFLAVIACVCVCWPLTGNPSACLLPLTVPIFLNRSMFSSSSFRRLFSMCRRPSSYVSVVTVLGG